jgi:uncharacterized protein
MTIKGQIIGGDSEFLLVRQKNNVPLEIGELVICEKNVIKENSEQTQKILAQVIDTAFSSQLSTQNLELMSGMHLEEAQKITLFEEHLRTYTVAKLKMLLNLTENKSEKSLPKLFSEVRSLNVEDVTFLHKKTPLNLGFLRSGSTKFTNSVYLDMNEVLSHHILIAATTGKGKSNLMKHILYSLHSHTGLLIFDPHDEYFGKKQFGLKDNPNWSNKGMYFTFNPQSNHTNSQNQHNQNKNPTSQLIPGTYNLHINLKNVEPKHITNILDLSQPQIDLLYAYYSTYGEEWIEQLLLKGKINHEFMDGTYAVVTRRVAQSLDIQIKNNQIYCNGIFQKNGGESTIQTITKKLEQSGTIIIDTSHLSSITELIVSSLITNHIYDAYKYYKTTGELDSKPVISVILEEAPRVIGKDVLEKGPNIFGTIAKEGRKFKIGLCAITQLPSLIPKTILANMNTKIILGLELAAERNAIIESASQDLSSDSRNIASLDKGEAIISSNFARIATPIAIPLFKKENYIPQNDENFESIQKTVKKTQIFGI